MDAVNERSLEETRSPLVDAARANAVMERCGRPDQWV